MCSNARSSDVASSRRWRRSAASVWAVSSAARPLSSDAGGSGRRSKGRGICGSVHVTRPPEPDINKEMTARQRFEALYRESAGAILACARRRTGPADADEICADVFLIAWRRLEDVPENPRIWLLAVAHHVL